MRHTELSREALAVLELIPAWSRRPPYAELKDIGFKSAFLMLVVIDDDRAKRLWERIAETMLGLGFHADWVAQAVFLPSIQAQRLMAVMTEQRPRTVLVFGKPLGDALMALDGNLTQGIELVLAPAMAQMLASGQAKSQLWALLCGLPQKVVPPQ